MRSDWWTYPLLRGRPLMVSPLRRVTLERAQSNQRLLPLHSVPRLGSACPNEGIDPWAAATGHPWPGAANPASLPGYPRLNACVRPSWLTGRSDQDQERDGGLPAGLKMGRCVASPHVGAGLPAKAPAQALHDLRAFSPASRLLRGVLTPRNKKHSDFRSFRVSYGPSAGLRRSVLPPASGKNSVPVASR